MSQQRQRGLEVEYGHHSHREGLPPRPVGTTRKVEQANLIQTSCEESGNAPLLDCVQQFVQRDADTARNAYRLFEENPQHPSLHFKRIGNRDPIYSVRMTLGCRALGLVEDNQITWFWIETHADYEKLIEPM